MKKIILSLILILIFVTNYGWGRSCQKAPSFSLYDLSGKKVSLEDFNGKVVLLNFFATYCPPCRIEIPGFSHLFKKYKKQGFIVIGISLDEEPTKVLPYFVKYANVDYPILIGNDEVIAAYNQVFILPTSFLIDQKGCLIKKFVGLLEEKKLEEELLKLLNPYSK